MVSGETFTARYSSGGSSAAASADFRRTASLELDAEADLPRRLEPDVRVAGGCQIEPGQRLDADEAPVTEVDDRLEHQARLVRLESRSNGAGVEERAPPVMCWRARSRSLLGVSPSVIVPDGANRSYGRSVISRR